MNLLDFFNNLSSKSSVMMRSCISPTPDSVLEKNKGLKNKMETISKVKVKVCPPIVESLEKNVQKSNVLMV